MKHNENKRIAIGAGIVGIVGAVYYFIKRKPVPPDEDAGMIDIAILDSDGNPVPVNSPARLAPGQTYTVQVSVTNRSTQGGAPVGAVLTTAIESFVNGTTLIPAQDRIDNFSANGMLTFQWNLPVPTGLYGVMGNVVVNVLSPLGTVIAGVTVQIEIVAEVIYGADVDTGVETPPGGFDPWTYDTNGSHYIEISEQLVAVQDYMGGLITLGELNQVKYLFENNIMR